MSRLGDRITIMADKHETRSGIQPWLLHGQATIPISSILETDLNALFDELNAHFWNGRLPEVPVIWNSRMRTGAAFLKLRNHRPFRIDLNPRYFENETEEHLEGLLLHEMCHLVFPNHRRGFKLELKRVGGLYNRKQFNPLSPLTGLDNQLRHEYKCPTCGRIWIRKRRYGHRMLCPKCRRSIQLIRSWRG